MEANEIADKLDTLHNIRAEIGNTKLTYDLSMEMILQPVQDKIDELKAEIDPIINDLEKKANSLENEIKQDVLKTGETVKGLKLAAIFVERSNWDSKGLEGYMLSHPEIAELRTNTWHVQIRKIGNGNNTGQASSDD